MVFQVRSDILETRFTSDNRVTIDGRNCGEFLHGNVILSKNYSKYACLNERMNQAMSLLVVIASD